MKLGYSDQEAFKRAWESVAEINPFPAIMGRICPHPCQTDCSRAGKDGAVAINALERFLGDWGLAQGLPLPRLAEPASRPESIGVIGAGPAGLSFAYQMARRGYRVTVYESHSRPGGALYFGIPQYRLPEEVLEAEIARIVDLGVDLQLDSAVGRDLDLTTLRNRHEVLFLGIGAGRGLRLGLRCLEGGKRCGHIERGRRRFSDGLGDRHFGLRLLEDRGRHLGLDRCEHLVDRRRRRFTPPVSLRVHLLVALVVVGCWITLARVC